MDRRRLTAAFFCVLLPAVAEAQGTGFFTAFIGSVRGGDVRDSSWTPGASIAIVEGGSGIGAEIDLSHVPEFDRTSFVESSITTLMLNVTGVLKTASIVRPYGAGGLGLLRVRACIATCEGGVSRTDLAFDAGGGVFVLFNESFGARADVRYFRYFARHDDLPLRDNGIFDFWRLTIGGTVSWPIR